MGSFDKYMKYGVYLVVLLFGLFLGYLFFYDRDNETPSHAQHTTASSYTCSMHPSVVSAEKGTCPICEMDLVLMDDGVNNDNENHFEMGERAMALANVQTSVIGMETTNNKIFLSGEITLNEKTNATQTTLFDGRLERLDVNFIGEYVKEGQRIGTIYSPELYLAQDKLLTSASYKDTHEKLYAAARNTLGLWKLTDTQIDDLLKSGKPIKNFPLVADVSGTVVEILASEGTYFKQGDPLFRVSRLYVVWAVFQAYENQLPFLKIGQEVVVSSEGYNGKPVKAKISFIEPILNRGKRVVSVRVDIDNKAGKWKPGMFVKGEVEIGEADNQMLMVPKSAVLFTGEKSVVYTKPNANKSLFEMKQVELGQDIGDYYLVLNGLALGDEVVTNGAFTIDAAAQLSGKKSMMYAADTEMKKSNTNQVDIPIELNDRLKKSLSIYFELKNNLVESSAEKAIGDAKKLSKELEAINVGELSDEWQVNIKSARNASNLIKGNDNLDEKRLEFKKLSKNFTFFATQIKGLEMPIYVQHCPMADNNTGADWLSLDKSIKNPYFGDKMLTCGSVISVVE